MLDAVRTAFRQAKMNLAAGSFLLLGTVISLTIAYEPYHMRLHAQIIRLENPQGIDYQGQPCGGQFTPRQCNAVVSAFVDTDSSVNPFHSGAESYGRYGPVEYKVLSVHQDDNDPHINQIISADICGKSIEKAVVKVRATEQDENGGKRINDFTCDALLQTLQGENVWSAVQLCQPEYQPKKMRLYFRYKVSRLEEKQCRQHQH
ncbi:hypothetical protein RvY_00299 [Ramazzottius varieornatus]|uniref:Uncharacterized protein n=1 Tax=Ramazzottius varieornatus TaxID=947166 RepID=A0A1D1UCB6_RAMVA|nr:hypothetical protein RvY_00299 [Ramazzottius varieornatus]